MTRPTRTARSRGQAGRQTFRPPTGGHGADCHPPRRTGGRAGTAPWWRYATLAGVAVAVLGAAMVLGFADLFGQRGTASAPGALAVRMSMAGFDPPVMSGTAGEELVLELWTTDSALHLDGGVHTLISDELGIYEELPANSRRTVSLALPDTPGDYDVYCDTCCGGWLSPSMHGVLRVLEA
jgi:cytochrome c oxidase subunit II